MVEAINTWRLLVPPGICSVKNESKRNFNKNRSMISDGKKRIFHKAYEFEKFYSSQR